VYLGPFTEGGNGPGGNAAAAIQTGCLAFINAVKTALSSSSLTLAVLSKPAFATTTVKTTTNSSGGSDTETKRTDSRAGAITPVTAVVGRNLTWDSQRRRTSAGTASTLLLSPERMQIDF
jgi:hypothetical protein